MKRGKEYKPISPVAASIEWLQLTVEDVQVLNKINLESKPEAILVLLNQHCKTAISYVRLAIFNKKIRQVCRLANEKKWVFFLSQLSKMPVFNCGFKIPRKLPAFDLMAGLVLINAYLLEAEGNGNVQKQVLILYLAAEIFHSLHAAIWIAHYTLKNLQADQKHISSAIRILNLVAMMHGSPGYLLYSFFLESLGCFYLQNKDKQTAANSFYLSYQYLITASKLIEQSSKEIYNASYGDLNNLSASKQYFSLWVEQYQQKYQDFISPIQLAAEQTASKLSEDWSQVQKGLW